MRTPARSSSWLFFFGLCLGLLISHHRELLSPSHPVCPIHSPTTTPPLACPICPKPYATRSPTPPPVVPSNAWFLSARAWATVASQRAWGEFECVGPQIDPSLSPRHNATRALWEQLGPPNRRCGCLHLVESPRFSPSRPCSVRPAPARCAAQPLWILTAGDSTFRYWYASLQTHLRTAPLKHASGAIFAPANRSLDDEMRFQGVYGLDEDLDSSLPDLVLSHRALWGTQTSKLLSTLRRPHMHHVKPYFEDPKVDHQQRQRHQPVLDEPLFVETVSAVPQALADCGPDLVLSGFGFWDIISLVITSGADTGNAEKDRCNLDRAGVGYKLFPSRRVTMLNAACDLLGADRFLVRTLNLGEIRDDLYPVELLNKPMKDLAGRYGLGVVDFFEIARKLGDEREDSTHAADHVVVRALCQVLHWLKRRPSLGPRKVQTIARMIDVLGKQSPKALCSQQVKGDDLIGRD